MTSGPTQEAIDDVRFMSNRSSGRMGAALARAALTRGADVTVVSGPVHVAYPPRVKVIQVRSALQMAAAVEQELPTADWVIGAAAVADYRPAHAVTGKIRRGKEREVAIELVANPDIIAMAAANRKPGARVVAFAAEPGDDPGYAARKREEKGVDAIAMNDISRSDRGFEAANNQIRLITAQGEVASPWASKLSVAFWLLDQLATVE
jgi:phosphopantothenoylcysteine decarboxylase/phosphopantothenate--cysteine ligase